MSKSPKRPVADTEAPLGTVISRSLDTRELLAIACQEIDQHRLNHRWRGTNRDHPGVAISEGTGALLQTIDVFDDRAATSQKVLAFRCQLHSATDPIEQGDTQPGFQYLDLTGRRRLAHVEARSRPRHATIVNDGNKSSKLLEVHI